MLFHSPSGFLARGRVLFASVLLLALSACALSTSRARTVQECEQDLLAMDKNLYRFPKMRRCLCVEEVEKKSEDPLAACGAVCMLSYSMLDSGLFHGEAFTRCICDGVEAGIDENVLWKDCSNRHRSEDVVEQK